MTQFELLGIDPEGAKTIQEYAKIRSIQVGVPYDVMINAFLSAIHRKSPLILDNLGIHTPSLTQKDTTNFSKAVAEVIKEQKLIK